MKQDFLRTFKNPPNEYRGKPFWSWNGDLDKEELLRQIDVMEQMGFGGYFMHSRTGLVTEYLGKEWFELINTCAQYGIGKGMKSWLYDEDRWPSGTAGGKVTEKKENRMKYLEVNLEEIEDEEAVICIPYNNQFACFKVVEMDESSFYNGNTYLDTMKKSAVKDFINLTHEKYKENCSKEFGESIEGIFTDEPHRGPLFSTFSGGNEFRVPYTDNLFEEFEKRFGYDLKSRLCELFFDTEINPVKLNFIELLQQLFIENFAKPINSWCKKNNLKLTGHVLQENSLSAQTIMQGSLMRFYEHMTYPGVDILTEDCSDYWVVKQLSSVARQMNKKWLLSELYGCTGWQMNFNSHKNVGDWQALFGINLRCHHLSWYTMGGQAKRDYPASILHQSAWYKEYKYVEDYFSRLNAVISLGKPYCELLVINPIESVWARVYSGCFKGLSAKDKNIIKLEEKYKNTFKTLCENNIDFDYGDEDILSRIGKVEGRALKVGNMIYKKVLISGMETIRKSTMELLQAFADNGGEVIVVDEKPEYIDGITRDFPLGKLIEFEKIPQYCSSDMDIKTNRKEIYSQIRIDKGTRYVVLLNIDREENLGETVINLGKGKHVFQLNARNGEKELIDYIIEDEDIIIETEFYPGEEKIYVIEDGEKEVTKKKSYIKEIKMPKEYNYRLSEKNICVLDLVKYSFDRNGSWSEDIEILKADRKIRDKYNMSYRSGNMLQPWFVAQKEKEIKGQVYIKFEFFIEKLPKDDIELVLEHHEDFDVEINNKKLQLKSTGKWIDICFEKYSIPKEILKEGLNEIVLGTKFHETNDLEAIYLLGNFGVKISGVKKTITDLPKTLSVGDVSLQGLPFYSGEIEYITEMDEVQDKNVEIEIEYEGACALVNEEIIAFKPYKADITDKVRNNKEVRIKIVLTRRNTFGPLHLNLPKVRSYGPNQFITDGEKYREDYALIKQGLIEEPKIKIFKWFAIL